MASAFRSLVLAVFGLPAVVVALSVMPAVVVAAPAYVAVPLGSLGGASIYGTGINAAGQVVGWGDTDATGATHRHAFIHSGGVLTNLGTLAGGTQSFARGINDAGSVAGQSNASGSSALRAVVYGGGAIDDLTPVLQGTPSSAYAVNAAGDVAGGVNTNGATHAYRYRGGVLTDLGTFGGLLSQAYGINAFGEVTGYAHLPSQDSHAFRYDAGGLVDLGTLGGSSSIGYAVDPLGQVVGETYLTGDAGPHAFLHNGAAMLDLGTLGGGISRAFAINSADTIVGESSDAQGTLRAFVLAAGTMVDLNTVTSGLNGATLSTATAVNDAGQIVAMSCTALLSCPQAFRLDPVQAPTVVAVEYHHAGFDHYFMTAIADEIAKLDNGTIAGWTRTGGAFNVYAGDQVGTSPVCRFFSTAFAPKSSHFYTASSTECATVQRNPDWQFEARVFNVAVPDVNGTCGAGTQPVYRLYNNGMGAAPNHRYTTSLATRTAMIGQGWVPEGYGPDAVIMCAPT
jgi:probable HAF family extracellular repeat protein